MSLASKDLGDMNTVSKFHGALVNKLFLKSLNLQYLPILWDNYSLYGWFQAIKGQFNNRLTIPVYLTIGSLEPV